MLRERLRADTREHHERIEQRLALPQKLRSEAAYAGLLQAFYGFYEPVETRLMKFSSAFASLDLRIAARLKSSKLRADLTTLGMTQEDLARVPRCADLPAFTHFAHGLGALYVLEGSTLGGQIIVRQLRSALPHLAASTAFFTAYGANTGVMWRSFTHALNRGTWSQAEVEDAVEGARDTFDSIERWLAR